MALELLKEIQLLVKKWLNVFMLYHIFLVTPILKEMNEKKTKHLKPQSLRISV
jgi:hypothetical protein